MNCMEIHTAVDYGLPVIWIVLNNSGHGMVTQAENILYGRPLCSEFKRPMAISRIAEALGARAMEARDLPTFTRSLRQALELRQPCVIDAFIDRELMPGALRSRVSRLGNSFRSQERPAPEPASAQPV